MSHLSMGYYGPPMLPAKFVDDPFAQVAPCVIQLCDYEVDAITTQMGIPRWSSLNPSEQRAVARAVLERRGDPTSLGQLAMLGLNNPNYNSFEIIVTGHDDRPTGSLINHFLT